jgi:hypothetical protein
MGALLDSIPPTTALGLIITFVVALVGWCSTVTYWIYDIRITSTALRTALLTHQHIDVGGQEVVWYPPVTGGTVTRPMPSIVPGKG